MVPLSFVGTGSVKNRRCSRCSTLPFTWWPDATIPMSKLRLGHRLTLDQDLWTSHIRGINPFVAELPGELVGYADLQANGYIDHFFVSGHHGRCGIGTALMNHLLSEARATSLPELTSNVSRTAQPFYAKFGFTVVEQRKPELRGVVIPNALMRLQPRFLSWTRPSGPLAARLGRRDDAAGSCPLGGATTPGALPAVQSGA